MSYRFRSTLVFSVVLLLSLLSSYAYTQNRSWFAHSSRFGAVRPRPLAPPPTKVKGNTKWAIVLCKFSDVPDEPQPPEFFRDFFTETGVGGLFDYWRDMSYGKINLTGSQVRGWYTLPVSRATAQGWSWPGARSDLINAGIAAGDGDFDYPDYYGIIVILNAQIDSGSVGNGAVARFLDGQTKTYGLIDLDPGAWNVSFAAHEMGHGYGLGHSFDLRHTGSCAGWGGPGEYCDAWDIMSAMTFGGGNPTFKRKPFGVSGPGLNGGYRHMLGWIPSGRIWSYSRYTDVVPLAGLQTPTTSGYLVALVPIGLTPRYYAVEFRQRLSWDRNIGRDAVLVREVKGSRTYLQNGNRGRADLEPGDYFASAANNIMISVLDIDSENSAAVVKIGRYPSGTTSTTATLTPLPNADGWRDTTQVTLTANSSAGVQSITYAAAGAQRIAATTVAASSTSFTISKEGETTIVYSASGNDRDPEVPRKLTLTLNKTPPMSRAELNRLSPAALTVYQRAYDKLRRLGNSAPSRTRP